MARISRVLSASVALGLLCMAPSAHAFTLQRCADGSPTTDPSVSAKWRAGTLVTFLARNSDFDRGPEESSTRLPNTYKSVLEWAIAQYERAPHNLDAFIRYDTPVTGVLGNGNNEIFFVSDPNQACSDGCTYNLSSCASGMTESDVRFRKRVWTTSTAKGKHWLYAADKFIDFRSVALHELGHSFGLGHTATTFNLMGDSHRHSHTNGAFSVPFIGADDANGLVRLYGNRSAAKPEISVSHWRFTSPDPSQPAYSLHRFESIYDSAGGKTLTVGTLPNSQERLYTVKRGQVVRPEFSLESTGVGTGTGFEVRYYLSTDDDIGTTDQLLATFSGQTLGTFANKHYQQSVRIPTNATTGRTLYLGIIVDALNQISEEHEDSFGNPNPSASTGNATYIPITIVP
jgi:hypothetical protein